jgi:hypothetical protein
MWIGTVPARLECVLEARSVGTHFNANGVQDMGCLGVLIKESVEGFAGKEVGDERRPPVAVVLACRMCTNVM